MARYNPNGTVTVERGDTLYGIYGPQWRQASQYTGDPRLLQIGSVLPNMSRIPQSVPQQPSQRSSPAPQSTPVQTPQYQSMGMAVGLSVPKPNNMIPDFAWNQVVQGAKKSFKKYGVPASVTIAQFLQETGGNPKNFIGGTNVFGIKGSGPAGTVRLLTTEEGPNGPYKTFANFAVYNSIEQAVEEHGKLLTQNPAYGKVQNLIAKGNFNPFDYASALQGVYATDRQYARKLGDLISTYGLAHADDVSDYLPRQERKEETPKPSQETPKLIQPRQYEPSATLKRNYSSPLNQKQLNLSQSLEGTPSTYDFTNQLPEPDRTPVYDDLGRRFMPGHWSANQQGFADRTGQAVEDRSRQITNQVPPLEVRIPTPDLLRDLVVPKETDTSIGRV